MNPVATGTPSTSRAWRAYCSIRFEARRVEAERAQHVHDLSAAGARVENASATLQIRCERPIAIQRAASGPGNVPHRWRRLSLVVEPVFGRVIAADLLFARPRVRPDEPAHAADRRPQRMAVAIASADHLDVGRAAQIAGNRTLSHGWRPARTAAARTPRGNSWASGRTSAGARARRCRPAGGPSRCRTRPRP